MSILWSDVERQCKNSLEKPIVRALFHAHFGATGNFFARATELLAECLSSLRNKSVPVCLVLLDELERYKSSFPNWRGLLSIGVKTVALYQSLEFKNTSITEKVCRMYCLLEDKMKFIPVINDLLLKGRYSEACTCVIAIQLQRQYTLEDIAIPLVFQDRSNQVEMYVRNYPDLQLQLVKYLDSLTVAIDACDRIIRKLHLSDVKREKLRPKTMGKLVARFVKLFNIPPEVCPNLSTYRSIGALKYLITKKYTEHNITEDSWDELVQSTVGSNEALIRELVIGLVCANEPREARKWAEFYCLPVSDWPDALQRDESKDVQISDLAENWEEEVSWDEDATRDVSYLPFSLEFSEINLVDDKVQYCWCMEHIVTNYKIVGIDGEWKPTFGLAASRIALLQLAVRDGVYLLDMLALQECLGANDWRLLADGILCNPRITKLGYGFASDMDMLSKFLPNGKETLRSTKNIVDFSQVCEKLKVFHPDLLPPDDADETQENKGLSMLAKNVLGLPLDKAEQFSDWERRPLRHSQVVYAATDAYCLLQIYDSLCDKAQRLAMDFDSLLLEMTDKKHNGEASKKKKTAASKQNASAGTSSGRIATPPPFNASDFRVVVDNMLQGLGRHLRVCGIDAVVLDNGDDHEEAAKIAQRDNRFILSSGAPYQMLKGHMPEGMCMNVPCGLTAHEQAELVFVRYNIQVKKADVFSRCPTDDDRWERREFTKKSKKKKEYVPFPAVPSSAAGPCEKTIVGPPESFLDEEHDPDHYYDEDDGFYMYSA